MALNPFHHIAGIPPQPQFLIKDYAGREYGVVEYYETDPRRSNNYILLEFFSSDPAQTLHPLVWLDLDKWAILRGAGKNLPDPDFEGGLEAYLVNLPKSERDLRKERARRARYVDVIRLAEKGYSIAYQEIFPGELRPEDFPLAEIAGKTYLVDDQYVIQPGDYQNQVTLVFIESVGPTGELASPSLLCNWLFGTGYEIVTSQLEERVCHVAIGALVSNIELEKTYRERLLKMRREGVLLGVKPKPYSSPKASMSDMAAEAPEEK